MKILFIDHTKSNHNFIECSIISDNGECLENSFYEDNRMIEILDFLNYLKNNHSNFVSLVEG